VTPNLFVAELSRSLHPGNGGVAWKAKEEELACLKKRIEKFRDHFRYVQQEGFAEIERQNATLTDVESGHDSSPQANHSNTANPSDFHQLIHDAIKGSNKVSAIYVQSILGALYLNEKGRVSDEEKSERLAKGIRELINFHFENKTEKKRAEILGGILFDGNLVGEDGATHIATSVASSVTRQVFTPQAILKAIDSSCQGSMNDCSVSDYACIEKEQDLFKYVKGHSLLPYCQRVTEVRKILNNFAQYLFKLEHNKDPMLREHGDYVKWDYECLLRYLLKQFGLKPEVDDGQPKRKRKLHGEVMVLRCAVQQRTNSSAWGCRLWTMMQLIP
jgi:hypothetical protein